MKNRIAALPLLLALFCSGCYDDYVEDYDHSGVYVAYQYDLRSFIVGEEMSFEIGSVLGGVIENERDRSVYYVLDDDLVDGDLSPYSGAASPFTAWQAMSGSAAILFFIMRCFLFPVGPSFVLHHLFHADHLRVGDGHP